MIGTRLPADAVGDLEIVFSFKDEVSGKTLEVREPFTVAPAAAASASGGR